MSNMRTACGVESHRFECPACGATSALHDSFEMGVGCEHACPACGALAVIFEEDFKRYLSWSETGRIDTDARRGATDGTKGAA